MTRARDVANLIGSGNYSSTTFTATAGQTAFTISHTQGFIQVFMNGLLLDETVDYTSNGSAVTLTSGAAAGDEIEVVAYNTFSVGDALNTSAADARYYTQSAADTRYVNTTGDSMVNDGEVLKLSRTSGASENLIFSTQAAAGISSTTYVGQIESAGNNALEVFTTGNIPVHIGTNNAVRMTVDGSGRVTIPSQPYGEAEGNNGGLLASFSSGSIINWLTANHTNGGMSFSNSGRFTVPVAGRYLVSALIYYYPSGSHTAYYSLEIKKNGSLETFKIDDVSESVSGSIDRTVQMTTIVRCAANDYLELGWSSNINASFWRGQEHNKFRVLLLN